MTKNKDFGLKNGKNGLKSAFSAYFPEPDTDFNSYAVFCLHLSSFPSLLLISKSGYLYLIICYPLIDGVPGCSGIIGSNSVMTILLPDGTNGPSAISEFNARWQTESSHARIAEMEKEDASELCPKQKGLRVEIEG